MLMARSCSIFLRCKTGTDAGSAKQQQAARLTRADARQAIEEAARAKGLYEGVLANHYK